MAQKIKLLHTSDWHLGQRLYNYDRTDEEEHFLTELAAVVKAEQPDAMLISGDIYDTCAPGNEVARHFTDRLLDIQACCPSMEIIVIAGNHDSYSRLEVDQSLWARCHVRILGTPAEHDDGTADFAKNIIVLEGKGVIAAVPFCHPRNFPRVGETTTDAGRDAEYFRGLREAVEAANPEHLPTVLMAHLAVGKETMFTGQDRSSVIGGQECVEPEVLGTGYDYVALGHIHCPQWVKKDDRNAVRYCGTPRPIHFDEVHSHAVDIVEIMTGQAPELRSVPLKPLRTLRTIGGKDGIPFEEALQKVAEIGEPCDGDYLRLNVKLTANEVPSSDWSERARLAAAGRGMRFCIIKTIREEEEGPNNEPKMLTLQEIFELSDDEVLKILRDTCNISKRQEELLKDLMTEMNEENNN